LLDPCRHIAPIESSLGRSVNTKSRNALHPLRSDGRLCNRLLNDRFGHDVGDAALTAIATLLRNLVRPADLVARLGGDEFALWLDGADELTAAERAEWLRLEAPAALAETLRSAPISLSVGIASRQAGSGELMDEVIRRADQAMYEVKRSGRGHWRVSQPESVP